MAHAPLLLLCLTAQHPTARDLSHDQAPAFAPRIVPASDEGRAALARFELAPGLKVELAAAEPLFANPVAFWPARDGRVYVAETFRHHQGVTDIRDHMDWLDDDLAATTVAERVAYFQKQLGPRFPEYERAYDRVSLLADRDGDGVFETSSVFSQAFTGAAAGIAAGVLEHRGEVFVTSIPSVWKLRDRDGDGRADEQLELSTGYGVHVALLGHDLHGLAIGPDQRLYFSIGDRGFSTPTPAGEIRHAHTGAVLRCELDGSGLEVYATGLRNPQELAFDDQGELFTGDNNSDGGDKARLVHVIAGGDSGWRQSYQWVTEPSLRGPWNDEQLWHPAHAGQPAYIVPPIANFADGPSGLAIAPGTGFGAEWNGRLFLCDFRGDAATSGVHALELKPKGASFELAGSKHVIWKVLATDCDFGPDGALYVTDWTQGWAQPGKGRLYRVSDPAARASEATQRTRELLSKGLAGLDTGALAPLLAWPDRRVRQEAHFELAARGAAGTAVLLQAATTPGATLPRVHAIWGLGIQLRRDRRSDPGAVRSLLAADRDADVRAAAARVLGEARAAEAFEALHGALEDASPRVRREAALGLARARDGRAVTKLVALARATGDADPVLRHAAIFGLAGCATPDALRALASDPDVHVRLAAVVALRMLDGSVVPFLADADERVRAEAARAIDDEHAHFFFGRADDLARDRAAAEPFGAPHGSQALAALLSGPAIADRDLGRRAINAAVRTGATQPLFACAGNKEQDERLRREALARLAQWRDPPTRDPVSSAWRPHSAAALQARRAADLRPAIAGLGRGGILEAPPRVLEGWLELVARFEVAESAALLQPLLASTRPSSVRCAALEALSALRTPGLREAVQVALADADGELRAVALDALTRIAPAEARPLAERVLATGELRERRAACRILGALADPAASAALGAQLERLAAGLFPVELGFDLVAAARARKDPALDVRLRELEARRALDPALAPHLDALFGGDREAGKQVFREKAETTCLRCHKIEWDEGGSVGPDLRGLGKRLSRLQVLESIVQPNRHVTAGYRNTIFALADERVIEARILLEDETKYRVLDAEARTFDLLKSEVEERRDGVSAMPEGLERFLTPRELRDLIEYISSI